VTAARCALLGAALLVAAAGCSESPTSSGANYVPRRGAVIPALNDGAPRATDGLWIGPDGHFYIANSFRPRDGGEHNDLYRFDESGRFLAEITVPAGPVDVTGTGIASVDADHQRVLFSDHEGQFLRSTPFPVTETTPALEPHLMAVGDDGRILLYDRRYPRVLMIGPDGTLEGEWGEFGSDPGEFGWVTDIELGPDGSAYLLDGDRWLLHRYSPRGDYVASLEIVRSTQFGYSMFGNVEIDDDGTVFVWDTTFIPGRLNIFAPGSTQAGLVDIEPGNNVVEPRYFALQPDGSIAALYDTGEVVRMGRDGRLDGLILRRDGFHPGESLYFAEMHPDGQGGAWCLYRAWLPGVYGDIPPRLDHFDASGNFDSRVPITISDFNLHAGHRLAFLGDIPVFVFSGQDEVLVRNLDGSMRFQYAAPGTEVSCIAPGSEGGLLVARRQPASRFPSLPDPTTENYVDIVSSSGSLVRSVTVPTRRNSQDLPYSIVDLHRTARGKLLVTDSQGTIYELGRNDDYLGVLLDSTDPDVPIGRVRRVQSDAAGFLYLLDDQQKRIVVATPEGTIIGSFGNEDIEGEPDR
jgi:hypothetical protein